MTIEIWRWRRDDSHVRGQLFEFPFTNPLDRKRIFHSTKRLTLPAKIHDGPAAVFGPIPGTRCNCSTVAEFKSTG
jgi:hypothetical protein